LRGDVGWYLNPALRTGLLIFIAFGDGLVFEIAPKKFPSNYDGPSAEKNHKKGNHPMAVTFFIPVSNKYFMLRLSDRRG
jgi:hypothetical protein